MNKKQVNGIVYPLIFLGLPMYSFASVCVQDGYTMQRQIGFVITLSSGVLLILLYAHGENRGHFNLGFRETPKMFRTLWLATTLLWMAGLCIMPSYQWIHS